MPTDDERREVAQKLRAIEPDDFSSYSEEHEFVEKALGIWDDYDTFLWHVVADLIEPQPITGDTSDGYHTFDELYDHRAKLFSVIVRCFKDSAWKSKLHSDGTMYEGMFGKMRHSTKEERDAYEAMLKSMSVELHPVDRAALLALAGDIQDDAAICPHEDCRDHIAAYARRIREALEVDK